MSTRDMVNRSIPSEAKLTKRPEEIPAYDDMPAELKPIRVAMAVQ